MSKKKKNQSPEDESIRIDEAEVEVIDEPAAEAAIADENPLEAELAAEKEKYLRLAAEYDNFRKRSAKERELTFSNVRSDTILKFLPVYDNLARALSQETADEAYRKGVEMTMTQLKGILESLGVTEIEAVGKTFDPDVHDAVMHIDDENFGENEVVLELQKGFKLGDRVIRFSMVQVAN